MPRMRLVTATSSNINTMLPKERTSITLRKRLARPVRVTVPTMMPAAAVATPMPIMLRAPMMSPSHMSLKLWTRA